MKPKPGDVVVDGKHGLSAFPGTDLEAQLREHGIETIALAGFMTNCCVESTMREACEKGFNVVTLTDCLATTSAAGQKASIEITFPFFSTPLNSASFLANLRGVATLGSSSSSTTITSSSGSSSSSAAQPPAPVSSRGTSRPSPPPPPPTATAPHPHADWEFRTIQEGSVYQVGPWFVDVRQSHQGGKLVLRSGQHELQRYLTFAQASGMMGAGVCAACDAVYTARMPGQGEATEPFGWLCNMAVVRLSAARGGGCLLYSPVLGDDGGLDAVVAGLAERDLLPVRVVVAPSPQHHLALGPYQQRFPDASFVCGKGSGQMPPLTRKRRDIRFDCVLGPGPGPAGAGPSVVGGSGGGGGGGDGGAGEGSEGGEGGGSGAGAAGAAPATAEEATPAAEEAAPAAAAAVSAPTIDREGTEPVPQRVSEMWELLQDEFRVCVVDDDRSGEIVLLHKASGTLLLSDLLYKSNPAVVGPGGGANHYAKPEWFAEGQQELFYGHPQVCSHAWHSHSAHYPLHISITLPYAHQYPSTSY
jgi:hypothetical protein